MFAPTLGRSVLLASSSVARLGLGMASSPLGLQPGLYRQPLSRLLPARTLYQALSPVSSKGYSRNGSHGSSSSSSRPSPWLLAAVPLVVAADAPAYDASATSSSRPLSSYTRHDLPLNAEIAAEISKGSVIGFIIGILVSSFSKTLVLLFGLAISIQSMAARAGFDLVHHFKLKERISSSRVLAALSEHTAFKLALGITLTMSAFMHF